MLNLNQKLETSYFEYIHEHGTVFSYGVKGCLVGILSIEARYHSADILEKIRAIFQDGEMAFYQLFKMYLDENKARILAKPTMKECF